MASAGDINHDGLNDIIIGRPTLEREQETATLFLGKQLALARRLIYRRSEWGGAAGLGIGQAGAAGTSLLSLGDINGDGIDDIIIAAPNTDESYVIFGQATGFGSSLDLSAVGTEGGAAGFKIIGEAGSAAGTSVASLGDVNGDQINDTEAWSLGPQTLMKVTLFLDRQPGLGRRSICPRLVQTVVPMASKLWGRQGRHSAQQ